MENQYYNYLTTDQVVKIENFMKNKTNSKTFYEKLTGNEIGHKIVCKEYTLYVYKNEQGNYIFQIPEHSYYELVGNLTDSNIEKWYNKIILKLHDGPPLIKNEKWRPLKGDKY